ncbi:hypothetical protein I4I84_08635 [Pseudonocardia sp. KRD-182]|uniref:YciI family protein n=1 Tax=Pseudonocardia oceani TaxID=2792013 RepID=UPI001C49DA2D|nr:YciI family protein [Pseudonocardia oceani]MBW0108786.1 hypothetical protein [Pseudonocardia oceani]
MALFALTYRYIDDPDAVAAHRPDHREYLDGLVGTGELVVAARLGEPGPAGGLLVFDVPSADRVHELADADPFCVQGVVAERTVQSWPVTIGADRLEPRER